MIAPDFIRVGPLYCKNYIELHPCGYFKCVKWPRQYNICDPTTSTHKFNCKLYTLVWKFDQVLCKLFPKICIKINVFWRLFTIVTVDRCQDCPTTKKRVACTCQSEFKKPSEWGGILALCQKSYFPLPASRQQSIIFLIFIPLNERGLSN
jgi:hypothetical protein